MSFSTAGKKLLCLMFSFGFVSSSVLGILGLAILPNLVESKANASPASPLLYEISDQESCDFLPTLGGNPIWNDTNNTCNITPDLTMNFSNPDVSLYIPTGVTLKNEGKINLMPIDVVFSIDSSGSMSSNDPSYLRLTGAIAFIDKLIHGVDQAAFVSWDGDDDDECVYYAGNPECQTGAAGTDADSFQTLTYDLDRVKYGASQSPPLPKSVCNAPVSPPQQLPTLTCGIDDIDNVGSGTNLEAGLYKAIEIMNANTRTEPSNKIIIFLTDGMVEGGFDYTLSDDSGPAAAAKALGYKVYAIGLGNEINLGFLSDMATTTQGGLYMSQSASNLDAIFKSILADPDIGRVADEQRPLDIVFSIDSSGSMDANDPTFLRLSAAMEFVDKLTQGVDQAAIVSWDGDDDDDCTYPNSATCPAWAAGTDSDWFQSLTYDLDQAKHGATANDVDDESSKDFCEQPSSPPAQTAQTTCGIEDIKNGGGAGGGTNLEAGLYKAIEVMDANTRVEPSNKIIIFLTDGMVEGGFDYTLSHEGGPAAEAQARGYRVYVVGLGPSLDLDILNDMADATGGELFISPTAANLDAIYDDIHETSKTAASLADVLRIYNNGTIANYGVIGADLIENGEAAILDNNAGGLLLMKGSVSNHGTINNKGLWINDVGVIFNAGIINEYCGSTIRRSGVIAGIPPVSVCFPIGLIADATNDATGQSLHAGGLTFYGETFGTGASIVSKAVDCATVKMRKFGSPTGTAEIGFYDSNMNLIKLFGSKAVSTLTTSYKPYEFCLPSTDIGQIIQSGQILAVKYVGGDSLNRMEVRRSNVGAGPDYDGLFSHHVNYDGIWHVYNSSGNSRDLLFNLTNS